MNSIVIIGSGGHANSLIDLIESSNKFKIEGYFDKAKNKKIKLKYLGDDTEIKKYKFKFAAIGIGLGLSPKKKMQLVKQYKNQDISFPKLIHKSSYVSRTCKIHDGAQVFAGTIINANSQIGSYTIINTGSIIEHDCFVGENSFICPGSIILGSCKIGKNTIIGSRNVILPNTNILSNTFIKAKI